jgi:hypothetical protein
MRADLQLVRCKTGLAIGKKPTSFITVCSTPQKGGTEQIRTQNWQKPTPIICPASPSQVRAPWQAGPSITRYKRYQPTTHKSASLLLNLDGSKVLNLPKNFDIHNKPPEPTRKELNSDPLATKPTNHQRVAPHWKDKYYSSLSPLRPPFM